MQRTIVIVGAGPTSSSLLERIGANASELLGPDDRVTIHLVDPHEAGAGRVWRPDASPLVLMNSLAEDVTLFPDASCTITGPVRTGPSLAEWSACTDPAELPEALRTEVAALHGRSFPTRLVQTEYLRWFHRRVVDTLPANVVLHAHRARAVDVLDGGGSGDGRRQRVLLDDGTELAADEVVLALGHLDADLDPERAGIAAFADRHGLTYLPPGHTLEQDLDRLAPGEPAVVLGAGQAFTDLLVLVTEGRGGRFVPVPDLPGAVRYEPSGREPLLWVGSRRGVPYRSKIDYPFAGPLAPMPRFADETWVRGLLGGEEPLELDRDVVPVLRKEIGWAYYHELFRSHPARVRMGWDEFSDRYIPLAWGAGTDALVAEAVPDPEDRLDFAHLDRPLTGLRFDDADALQAHLVAHVRGDVARRTDPAYSADAAKFVALLVTFGILLRIAASGRLTDRSRIEGVWDRWFGSFMYDASGPPPARLRQLIALAEAGVVRFVGADTTVVADERAGAFVATSSSHPDQIVARALVEAQIPKPSVERSADPLVRRLFERGELVEEKAEDPATGWRGTTGRALVGSADMRVQRADGTLHPHRRALGIWTSRPAGGALARPRTNALIFRQHDTVARTLLSPI